MSNAKATPASKKRKTKAEILQERRRVRQDLGSDRNVMYTPEDDNDWHYRWFNDVDQGGANTIAKARRNGWADMPDDWRIPDAIAGEDAISTGGGVELPVGNDKAGNPIKARLLRLPMEYHLADMALKEEGIKAKENDILGLTESEGYYGEVKLTG
jgi:hypothetical protein